VCGAKRIRFDEGGQPLEVKATRDKTRAARVDAHPAAVGLDAGIVKQRREEGQLSLGGHPGRVEHELDAAAPPVGREAEELFLRGKQVESLDSPDLLPHLRGNCSLGAVEVAYEAGESGR
jgi:hypothetical protein